MNQSIQLCNFITSAFVLEIQESCCVFPKQEQMLLGVAGHSLYEGEMLAVFLEPFGRSAQLCELYVSNCRKSITQGARQHLEGWYVLGKGICCLFEEEVTLFFISINEFDKDKNPINISPKIVPSPGTFSDRNLPSHTFHQTFFP